MRNLVPSHQLLLHKLFLEGVDFSYGFVPTGDNGLHMMSQWDNQGCASSPGAILALTPGSGERASDQLSGVNRGCFGYGCRKGAVAVGWTASPTGSQAVGEGQSQDSVLVSSNRAPPSVGAGWVGDQPAGSAGDEHRSAAEAGMRLQWLWVGMEGSQRVQPAPTPSAQPSHSTSTPRGWEIGV